MIWVTGGITVTVSGRFEVKPSNALALVFNSFINHSA